MATSDSIQLLKRLSLAAGPPGAEDEVRDIVRDSLREVGSIRHDGLGSLLCERRGSADRPRVVVDCHLDEVGFMVQGINAQGLLSFVTLGGWWGHVLLGQRVDVLTEARKIPGLIGATPPHHLSPDERKSVLPVDKMTIDVGASDRAQVEKLGIRVGDPVVPYAEFREMAVDGVLSGKALDNRIGVALMCETLCELARRDHPNTVIGVGAVQEEVGVRGAGTASEISRPDVALVLECTPADDLPGRSAEVQGALGAGPQVRLFDPRALPNRALVRFVEQVAAEREIEIQRAVRRAGGTNAAAIHRSRQGVPTVVVAVPARYIHSHVALMQWNDYVAARDLVLELIVRLDEARVDELTKFE